MDTITLLESTWSFSFSSKCKGCKWKERKQYEIISVFPQFSVIPKEDSKHFKTFCWSELLLYKHFHNISMYIGVNKEKNVVNWKEMDILKYNVWHINHLIDTVVNHEEEEEI